MMTAKHYADIDGNYIGSFDGGAVPPDGAVETPAPQNAKQKWNAGTAEWLPLAPVVIPTVPRVFATIGITVADGALASVEMAAELQGAYYEPGYLQVGFIDNRDPLNYLVFVQSDIPATMTQYKSEDGFELVFSDSNGDPVNPGRLDIQILEVR